MWQEARKQEKAIRGMMIDFQKRAERRKAYYQRMQQDPVQMIRVVGSKCTIHIDPIIAGAAENPKNMIPWQGDQGVLIDKYDARQWLDCIPETHTSQESDDCDNNPEEQKFNYERYRTLIQSDYLQISEEQRLDQIRMDEALGKSQMASTSKADKQKLAGKKAAISYSYGDTAQPVVLPTPKQTGEPSSDSDEDFDLVVKMDSLTKSQVEELNAHAQNYGISRGEFYRMLKHDRADYDAEEAMKEFEEIRKTLTGRKAKKQRRMERDKRRKRRRADSPVSYAKRSSPSYEPYRYSSRSTSPEESGKVEFITEFGAELAQTPTVNANPPLQQTKKLRRRRSSTSSSSESSPSDHGHSHSRRSHHRSKSRDRSHSARDRSGAAHERRSQRDKRSDSRDERRPSHSVSHERSSHRHSVDSRSKKRTRSRSGSRSRSRSPQTMKKGEKNTNESKTKVDLSKVDKREEAKKLTPQERLKKRMQVMLNKQFKSDKVKEREKEQQREQERKEREDDLRELTRLYREKARGGDDDDWFDIHYRTRSRSHSPSPKGSVRNRSRSRSPRSRYY